LRPALNDEQEVVCQTILAAVDDPACRLMFLPGVAGTGKTFTVRRLIELLHAQGKRCLLSATTGIAAVQYPGGTTLHSLFKMGMDEINRGPFVSPIGRRTAHAIHIVQADLIIVDEVSMLTPWVANKVSKILQWIGGPALEFGGMKFLFVGDLLQLPPVVPVFAVPVIQRLITRLRCWPEMTKFRLGRLMRATDPHWNELLQSRAKGEQDSLPTWSELHQFGVTVTDDTETAFQFLCEGEAGA
jgi:hypothetical protein